MCTAVLMLQDARYHNQLSFYLNGRHVVEREVQPETTLLSFLRSASTSCVHNPRIIAFPI